MDEKLGLGKNKYLDERYKKIVSEMREKESAIINRFSKDRKEIVGASRFFNNENIDLSDLISLEYDFDKKIIKGKHVLAIQDTTEVDFRNNKGKLKEEDKDLGGICSGTGVGFFIHPTLVVEAESGFPLSFSSIEIYSRDKDSKNKNERDYKKLPIESKESYRWIKSTETSKKVLKEAEVITYITDREGDIYDLFDKVPEENNHIIIRLTHNRKLYKNNEKLFEELEKEEVKGRYTKKIQGDIRIQKEKREALLEVKYKKIKISVPLHHNNKENVSESVELTAIEVKEHQNADVSKGIHWRLITSHEIKNIDDAKRIINWYSLRWNIEELFRILKKQGLELEESKLLTGLALKKLAVLALKTALSILQFMKERDGEYGIDAEVVFNQEEIEFMKVLNKKFESSNKSEKQKNKHKENSLAWAIWFIARLGGWKADNDKVKPGVITMKRGLVEFYSMFQGWCFAKEYLNLY